MCFSKLRGAFLLLAHCLMPRGTLTARGAALHLSRSAAATGSHMHRCFLSAHNALKWCSLLYYTVMNTHTHTDVYELNGIKSHIYWKDLLILAKSWWLWKVWDLKCRYSKYKLFICVLCIAVICVFLNSGLRFSLLCSFPLQLMFITLKMCLLTPLCCDTLVNSSINLSLSK